MVEHASKYPWSSYGYNGLGLDVQLITPHKEYVKLGKNKADRLKTYRMLFRGRMAEKTMEEIRDCTNKSWVLGDDRFKQKIETRTGIQMSRIGRGGDRKSANFKEKQSRDKNQ